MQVQNILSFILLQSLNVSSRNIIVASISNKYEVPSF